MGGLMNKGGSVGSGGVSSGGAPGTGGLAKNDGGIASAGAKGGSGGGSVADAGVSKGGASGAVTGGIQNLSKRYYVSKNFYRYIRPGATMVGVKTDDADLFVVAFVHPTMNATTIVAINNSSKDKPMVLGGDSLPSTYDTYRTSANEDCVAAGSVSNGGIVLKANSITTLVNGKFIE
jgi:hypothetical protein